jgi:high affinity Mn2+ porin
MPSLLHVTKKRMHRKGLLFLLSLLAAGQSFAQFSDTTKYSFHFQSTLIHQYHFKFRSPYEGDNSLEPDETGKTSLTNTFYFAARPFRNKRTLFILNPEIAGGEGFSAATGIAGFPNGETFRVGNPKPTLYLARLVIEHTFPLKQTKYEQQEDAANEVASQQPTDYLKFYAGRFCLADYFDGNPYSHDPRTQFMNWSYMSGGAWDYAADTRGYTYGIGTELNKGNWRAGLAFTMVPRQANGLIMDSRIGKAFASQLEVAHAHRISNHPGFVQVTLFFNKAQMGNYREAVRQNPQAPDINAVGNYKNNKYGIVLGMAQELSNSVGAYLRASWNDGRNETWAFTEIDRSVNLGFQYRNPQGKSGNSVGAGIVVNGIAAPHRAYLAAGGYGFMVGDGQLNYAVETIAELYYRINLFNKRLQLSPDYQFVVNPAYNRDRGPVHVMGIRAHVEL